MATTVAPAAAARPSSVRSSSVRSATGRLASVRPKGRTSPGAKRQGRGIMHTLMSMGAMLGVGAMLVSTSISGTTFGPGDAAEASQSSTERQVISAEVQSLGVVAAPAATAELVRDSYTAEAYVAPVVYVSQTARASNGNYSYAVNPAGVIQWPFAQPAPITYGFGPRAACSYCSSYHLGVDFTPGAGVPIQSIADGVVSTVADGGGWGQHVIVDHIVNGQRIQSMYAHMQWGSIQVAQGQTIGVGTVIGAVGSTGNSTGPHLHLEIHADGTPIDPFAWLKANAG